MFAGFDYGTSHCAIGRWVDDAVHLVPVEGDATLIGSALHAPSVRLELPQTRSGALATDTVAFRDLSFGAAALDAYLRDPTEGYFVRSPKSFLGASGLPGSVRERFVTVVAAMMANVKQALDADAQDSIDSVVIGRPVNFQGLGGREANAQALAMLEQAARLAGFTNVAFQYEPMAAALDYEARLSREELILVVDIGGGTTDCSFVRVGGAGRDSLERDADVLGHAGERRGGNDYDQALALRAVMPEFGFGYELSTGLPIPNTYFVDAISTNDVNAQQRFYGQDSHERLTFFARESQAPERSARLLALHEGRATYRLLRQVELGKIALSDIAETRIDLDGIEQGFDVAVDRDAFAQGAERLLQRLQALIDDVIGSAGTQPETVYLTGGMAKSRIVRDFLAARYPDFRLLDSDHFMSVTEGLTRWARRVFA
ncbi:MAG: molecular chaperone [Pseudomonadota bacterium]